MRIAIEMCLVVLSLPLSGTTAEIDYFSVLEAMEAYSQKLDAVCLSGTFREHIGVSLEETENYTKTKNEALRTFVFDFKNNRWRYERVNSYTYAKYSQNPFEFRNIRTFDGQKFYGLWHYIVKDPTGSPFPNGHPSQFAVSSKSIELSEEPISNNLTWLRFIPTLSLASENNWSLLGALQTEPFIWKGSEQISGVDCYKIMIPTPRTRSQTTVWLDPARDFLPLRQECRATKGGKVQSEITHLVETVRFENYALSNGTSFWLPVEGRMESLKEKAGSFELLDLRFLESLPVEQSRLDAEALPPGVAIRDYDLNTSAFSGGEEGKALYVERDKAYWEQEEKLKQKLGPRYPPPPPKKPNPLQQTTPNVTGKSNGEESDYVSAWMITNVCILLLLALGGLYFQWRRFRLIKKPK